MRANPNIPFSGPFDLAQMPAVVHAQGEGRVLSIFSTEQQVPYPDAGALWTSPVVEQGTFSPERLNPDFMQAVPGATIVEVRNRGDYLLGHTADDISRLFTVVLEKTVKRSVRS